MSKEKEKEFGSYLRKLRDEKRYTVRGLAEKSGVSSAYLSLLENGKKGIPSPEILKKLYGPLDVTYDELMEKAGHISPDLRQDLHPETIKIMESYNDSLNELVNNAADLFIKSITHESGKVQQVYKNLFVAESSPGYTADQQEGLKTLLQHPKAMQQIFDSVNLEEKIKILNLIILGFIEDNIDPADVFKNKYSNIGETNRFSVLTVPILGCIAAGQPILADDHIEEWIDIPNIWNLRQGEVFVLKVKGDSMIGSRIFEGDKVVVKIQQEVENGEIAVVNVNGDEATLKRVKKTETGQVILYPDNPRYEPIFIADEKARIIGKVIQVMFEPN